MPRYLSTLPVDRQLGQVLNGLLVGQRHIECAGQDMKPATQRLTVCCPQAPERRVQIRQPRCLETSNQQAALGGQADDGPPPVHRVVTPCD